MKVFASKNLTETEDFVRTGIISRIILNCYQKLFTTINFFWWIL